jgi:hypothetical protein
MTRSSESSRSRRVVVAAVTLPLVLVACGGAGGGGTAATTSETTRAAAASTSSRPAARSDGSSSSANGSAEATGSTVGAGAGGDATLACAGSGELDPANFVDPTLSTNPYHPLKPGTQWVRGGSTLVGGREVPYQVTSTMSDVIRNIEGVPAVAMLDESEDAGEVSQVGVDYLALDRNGNVWLLGGYTEDYEGGEYTNTEDHWLGPTGGSTVGVLAPAKVAMDTPFWCIGGDAAEDPSVGLPIEIGASDCVTFGCFSDIRIVQEGQSGAPDNEHKYYAPGVGLVRNVPLNASLHQDRFELLNLVELSPGGLDEVSRRVLDLEAHARQTSPEVFGGTPQSTRDGN